MRLTTCLETRLRLEDLGLGWRYVLADVVFKPVNGYLEHLTAPFAAGLQPFPAWPAQADDHCLKPDHWIGLGGRATGRRPGMA